MLVGAHRAHQGEGEHCRTRPVSKRKAACGRPLRMRRGHPGILRKGPTSRGGGAQERAGSRQKIHRLCVAACRKCPGPRHPVVRAGVRVGAFRGAAVASEVGGAASRPRWYLWATALPSLSCARSQDSSVVLALHLVARRKASSCGRLGASTETLPGSRHVRRDHSPSELPRSGVGTGTESPSQTCKACAIRRVLPRGRSLLELYP
jgi:hypothetical protein